MQALTDRIEKLEGLFAASKKRVHELQTSTPSLRYVYQPLFNLDPTYALNRASSLDTLHKTYRNIDITIQLQEERLAELTAKVAKLDLQSPQTPGRVGRRDKRLPDLPSPPKEPTPNVADATLAALNTERTASKLKETLLRLRKQPLLNTQASRATPPPSAFDDPNPVKKEWTPPSADFFKSMTLGKQPDSSPESSLSSPGWKLPPFQLSASPESPTPAYGPERGGSVRQRERPAKGHMKSAPLKHTPGTPTQSPPPNFSWGPLPGVAPKTTLSPDVTKREGPSNTGPSPSLSDSWVTDGFGKK